jgi:diguanylate cyclase (GGDEF)-like protein
VPDLHWLELHRTEGSPLLREALSAWGYRLIEQAGPSTALVVADRLDPRHIPPQALEVLWWVRGAEPEEVSDILARRPGWVVRQGMPLDTVKAALEHIRQRDLGSEGWLRQMLHLATLEELLRLVLIRAELLSGARRGAIWVRSEDAFFQRCGEGFPEAPLSQAEAAELVRAGDAYLLCPTVQMGLLRLQGATGDPAAYLGWIKEVEDLLVNAWNFERTQALSFRDDLTVARNRRALEAELPRVLREASSRNESVALMFMDVDNLKALNTAYGHPTGSRVLTHVALEAQRIIRTQDRLYRYGGDEFCIMLPGTAAQGAVKMGERLIQVLTRTPLQVGAHQVPISLSIGIAAYPVHADGAEHLMERADRALFTAKADGKGCVRVAS